MQNRPVTGFVVGRQPAEEGGVETDRHKKQGGDVTPPAPGVSGGDRYLEAAESAWAVHLADMEDQPVIEEALKPPELVEFLAVARRRAVRRCKVLDRTRRVIYRPPDTFKEFDAERSAGNGKGFLSIERRVNSHSEVGERRTGIDSACCNPGKLRDDIATQPESPFIGQAQHHTQLVPPGESICRLGVCHDLTGARRRIGCGRAGDRHPGQQQQRQKTTDQVEAVRAGAECASGDSLNSSFAAHGHSPVPA